MCRSCCGAPTGRTARSATRRWGTSRRCRPRRSRCCGPVWPARRLVAAGEEFRDRAFDPAWPCRGGVGAGQGARVGRAVRPAVPERDLVLALVVARVCRPASKLATTRWWPTTTLAPISASRTPPPTRCMRRWTGSWRARRRSRRASPDGISARASWCSMTCRARGWKALTARSPPGATRVTTRREGPRSSTG